MSLTASTLTCSQSVSDMINSTEHRSHSLVTVLCVAWRIDLAAHLQWGNTVLKITGRPDTEREESAKVAAEFVLELTLMRWVPTSKPAVVTASA